MKVAADAFDADVNGEVPAMAFINALNRLVAGLERLPLHPQKDSVVLAARPTL